MIMLCRAIVSRAFYSSPNLVVAHTGLTNLLKPFRANDICRKTVIRYKDYIHIWILNKTDSSINYLSKVMTRNIY